MKIKDENRKKSGRKWFLMYLMRGECEPVGVLMRVSGGKKKKGWNLMNIILSIFVFLAIIGGKHRDRKNKFEATLSR